MDIHVKGMPEETWKRFKLYLIEIHGTYYGKIGQELSEAIEAHLDRVRIVQHKAHSSKVRSDIKINIEKIRREFRIRDIWSSIPAAQLFTIIESATGLSDYRTLRRYRNLLLAKGYLRTHPDNGLVLLISKEWIGSPEETLEKIETVQHAGKEG